MRRQITGACIRLEVVASDHDVGGNTRGVDVPHIASSLWGCLDVVGCLVLPALSGLYFAA